MYPKNETILKFALNLILISLTNLASAREGDSLTNIPFSDFLSVGTANWSTDKNFATASKGNGFLVSKQRYDNFYLKVEFQAAPGTNSGIFIRCSNPNNLSDQSCYEINIFDTRPDPTYRTGSVTGHRTPKVLINTEDNQWHVYQIIAINDKIRVLLDGQETVYMRNTTHTKGSLALQLAQGQIGFRNLQIEELHDDTLIKQPTVLDGVWELEAMYTIDKLGQTTEWCKGSYGVILYTKGYMSTAVNCTGDLTKSVLYSGPFHLEGNTVYHHAQNSNRPGQNQIFSRTVELTDENHLVLSGTLGDSQVIVKWARR